MRATRDGDRAFGLVQNCCQEPLQGFVRRPVNWWGGEAYPQDPCADSIDLFAATTRNHAHLHDHPISALGQRECGEVGCVVISQDKPLCSVGGLQRRQFVDQSAEGVGCQHPATQRFFKLLNTHIVES